MSKWTSECPSAYVPILVCCEPTAMGGNGERITKEEGGGERVHLSGQEGEMVEDRRRTRASASASA